MFALKTLQIPLPGKHPPSPCLSNGSETKGQTNYESSPDCNVQRNLFDSFQSLKLKSTPNRKVSPAMSTLQGYYGLQSAAQRPASEGFEMTEYKMKEARHLEDGLLLEPSPSHRKSRSFVNVRVAENGEHDETDKWSDKLVRRRQKSEADFNNVHTPELLLKEDNSNIGGFPAAITGKGLALRPKAAAAAAAAANRTDSGLNPVPLVLGNSLLSDRHSSGVRKSSSTPSLHDQESSIWSSSKWCLKPDLQALSSGAIKKPIFDGLPKPISGRKNKTAVD
ncbi:LysM and putative peptidoglycan-binding domain-containing protein [Melia azedarach]|nr:LysM and putative peptidoglycan-binding domain-containing protein [Melia azedarach]